MAGKICSIPAYARTDIYFVWLKDVSWPALLLCLFLIAPFGPASALPSAMTYGGLHLLPRVGSPHDPWLKPKYPASWRDGRSHSPPLSHNTDNVQGRSQDVLYNWGLSTVNLQ